MNSLVLNEFVKDENVVSLIDKFFSKTNSVKKYVLGRNDYSKFIANILYVDAFIDDFTDEKKYLDKPILKLDSINKSNSIVLITSALRTNTVRKKVQSLEIPFIDIFQILIYKGLNYSVDIMNNLLSYKSEIIRNKNKFKEIYSLIQEKKSKQVFSDLLNFRLSGNVKYLDIYEYNISGQYFEDFLCVQDRCVFLDIGSFDGETSLEFIKRYPNYSEIYAFEPDKSNFLRVKENLKEVRNARIFNIGLSDRKGKIKMTSGMGSANKFTNEGTTEVIIDTLDNLNFNKIDFIKMDIEGAEYEALIGAKKTIEKLTPKLAISVYHKVDDFWKIPELILSFNNNYDLYLRHYTEGIHETVMFFIPKKGIV